MMCDVEEAMWKGPAGVVPGARATREGEKGRQGRDTPGSTGKIDGPGTHPGSGIAVPGPQER